MSGGHSHHHGGSGDHEHAHDHEQADAHHDHGHQHDDGHDHAHDHGEAPPRTPPQVGQHVHIEPIGGLSGDMFCGALLDVGVPLSVMEDALKALPLDGYHLHVVRRDKHHICARGFDVHVEGHQPERSYKAIDEMLQSSALAGPTKQLAREIFRRLAEAEGHVHGMAPADVHFHEVGAVDSIVDIVAAAAGLSFLAPTHVTGAVVPLGSGMVKAAHGMMPVPAPATLACLRGFQTVGIDELGETVTPTGAVIYAAIVQEQCAWPAVIPRAAGYGAGKKNWKHRPNLLRLSLGDPADLRPDARPGGELVELAANIDDMTGELTAHVIGALMHAGALDAWAVPTTTKKGRPGLVLGALGRPEMARVLEDVFLRESTTIGVRSWVAGRRERPRHVLNVETAFGIIPVKVSDGEPGPATVKPEFDACAAAAKAHGVPVRVVIEAASRAAVLTESAR